VSGVKTLGGSGRGVEDAIFPVMLADVAEAWRDILDVARDRSVAGDVRESALFWLGQEAAAAATEGLAEVASDEDEEQEVREAAVFALSQRPSSEGVPILMELARTAREPGTRKSDDERVVAFFREVLLGRRAG
jgi:HEAT repeat protein